MGEASSYYIEGSIGEEFQDFRASQHYRLTKEIWITKAGDAIKVVEMTDDHLRNTIRMLRRNREYLAIVEIIQISQYIEMAPDGAADAAMRELDIMEDEMDEFENDDDSWLLNHVAPYALMLKEAKRRKMNLEDQTHA